LLLKNVSAARFRSFEPTSVSVRRPAQSAAVVFDQAQGPDQ
jgi:hypothetical protein